MSANASVVGSVMVCPACGDPKHGSPPAQRFRCRVCRVVLSVVNGGLERVGNGSHGYVFGEIGSSPDGHEFDHERL
jgi:hypothetical protein